MQDGLVHLVKSNFVTFYYTIHPVQNKNELLDLILSPTSACNRYSSQVLSDRFTICCEQIQFRALITCDIYVAPYSARSYSKALYNIIYNIIIPDSDLFPSSTYLNSSLTLFGLIIFYFETGSSINMKDYW